MRGETAVCVRTGSTRGFAFTHVFTPSSVEKCGVEYIFLGKELQALTSLRLNAFTCAFCIITFIFFINVHFRIFVRVPVREKMCHWNTFAYVTHLKIHPTASGVKVCPKRSQRVH